jgi:hypothetical protein
MADASTESAGPSYAQVGANLVSNLFTGGAGAPSQAALSAIQGIATAPPPASAASLQTTNPITINPTALNLGSILQPLQGSPQNGAAGYNVSSPMGSISVSPVAGESFGISNTVWIAGIAGVALVIFLVMR